MPALPPVPNTIRVDLFWTIGEDVTAKNRLFVQYSGTPPSVSDANAFATAVRTAVNGDLKTLFSADRILTEVKVTDLNSATGAVGTDVGTVVGTRTGHTLAGALALVDSGKTARRFRGGHDRVYWPFGVDEDTNSDQTWGSTFLSQCVTGFTNFYTALAAAGWAGAGTLTFVQVSQYSGFTVHTGTTGRARNVSTPRTSPVLDAILEFIVATGIGVVRRRLLGLA